MSDSPDLPIETNDDALLRALQGATFAKDASITLPSGRVISGDEAQVFSAAFAKTEREPYDRSRTQAPKRAQPVVDLDNPLSSANDRWTGNPEIDRALLVERAMRAARQEPKVVVREPPAVMDKPHRRPWWKFWN